MPRLSIRYHSASAATTHGNIRTIIKNAVMSKRYVRFTVNYPGERIDSLPSANRDNSPLSEWIAYGFDITVLLVTERILPVFVKEVKVL